MKTIKGDKMQDTIEGIKELGMTVNPQGYVYKISSPKTTNTLDVIFKKVLPLQTEFKRLNNAVNVDGSSGIKFTNEETNYLRTKNQELNNLIDADRKAENYRVRRPIELPIIIMIKEREGFYCCMKKSEIRAHINHTKRLGKRHMIITEGFFISKFGDLNRVINKIKRCLDNPEL